jgi:thiol-disulfide isomerase/thioredoxin
MKNRLLPALATLLALWGAASAQTLGIGDPAPPVKVMKWVKGAAVDSFEQGKLYVVEFWATWCVPCKDSIPHLSEMAKRYGDKVTFAGISVWETGENKLKLVTDFTSKMGDRMAYSVALDMAAARRPKRDPLRVRDQGQCDPMDRPPHERHGQGARSTPRRNLRHLKIQAAVG